MAADTETTSRNRASQTGGTIPLKYPGRKLLTTLLAVLVALSMLPMAALASIQSAYAEGTGSVTVTVAAVDNNSNSFVLLPTEVTVPAGKAAEYGYANCAPGTMVGGEDFGIAAGQVSTLDALLAAHELAFGAGFNPNTCLIGDSAYFTGMFGLGAGGYTFTVNGKTPIGNYSNGYGINQYPLTDGELVVFIKGSDETGGMDGAAFFSELQKSVTTGEQFTLTLLGFDPLDALWANPGDPTRPLNSEPVEGAALKLADPATGGLSSLGVTTDSNGQATLSFSTPGTYVVSATGKIEVFSMLTWDFEYVTFGVPVSIITVTEAVTEPEGVCSIGNVGFSTLNEALAAAQSGDTIKLLANIDHTAAITISGKSITFDVNGFTLDVTVNSGTALAVNSSGVVSLVDTAGGGAFNVTSKSGFGVSVENNSSATVTNATGSGANYAGATAQGGAVTVLGDAKNLVTTVTSYGIWARSGAVITVYGNVTGGSFGATANNATVYVLGNVFGNSCGAQADSGGTVTIDGILTTNNYYVRISYSGGSNNYSKNQNSPTSSKPGYLEYKSTTVGNNGIVWIMDADSMMLNAAKIAKTNAINAVVTGLNEPEYTPESWSVLLVAIQSALSQVSAATTILAVQAVVIPEPADYLVPNPVFVADYTELLAAIDQALTLNASKYTPASWAVLSAALASAQGVAANTQASQSDVDQATAVLNAAISGLIVDSTATYIRVTNGAEVGVYKKGSNHFTKFTSYPLVLDVELSDDNYDVYAVELPTGGSMYHIEAVIPGVTAKTVRQFTVPSVGRTFTVDLTPLDEWVELNNGIYAANMYTNLPASGALNLSSGQSFDLDTFRISQGQINPTGYDFYEPDYCFEVFGTSATVERIGAAGREQLRITALGSGTSVIKVTYSPLEIFDTSGNVIYRFNGITDGNVGAVVVNVGGGEAFATGIAADCDFDTFYFDSAVGYKEFNFTPAAGTTVRVHEPLSVSDWDDAGAWTAYTAATDGSYTVCLTEGRNIIELTNGDSACYQVLRAKGVTVTVSNATSPGEPFEVGDTVSIKLSGLEDTIEKMSGIYNPGFNGGQFIRYSDGMSDFDSTRAKQWSSLTTEFSVSYTITRSGNITLTGICSINMMAYTGYTPGWHRNIPLTGLTSNPSGLADSMGPFYFSSLPEITISVAGTDDPGALAAAKLAKAAEVNAVLDGLNEADYTITSWAVLATAITQALAAVDAATTVGEVEAVVVPDASSILVLRPAYGDPGSGDLNGDGIVDMSEALRLAQVVVGGGIPLSAGQIAAMDMDFDGLLTMADVVLVMRRAAGL